MQLIKSLFLAFMYSLNGLSKAFAEERAFKLELILFAILFPALFFLDFTAIEKGILILNMFVVLIAELLNSAVEAVCDRVSEEHHDLIAKAKDTASASVLLALVSLGVVFLIFFFDL